MMKKLFKILVPIAIFISLTVSVRAQSPQKLSYQAVIRNSSNQLLRSQPVGMKISILQFSFSGSSVYEEEYNPNPSTNAYGLVTIEIGSGVPLFGNFASIDWSAGPYFIKIETDPDGGTAYSITGTSQLLSVPYAFYAKTAETLKNGTTLGEINYWNGSDWVAIAPGITGQKLSFCNGVPTWGPCPGATSTIPTVTNPVTNKIWMDRNLGASQVATSSTDVNAYGDLYQWGRAADGHQIRTSVTTSNLSGTNTPAEANFIIIDSGNYDWHSPQNADLWQSVNGVNNPCPSGFRIPTETEWEAERTSWSSNNSAGAFASPLKLPVAGYRIYSNGLLNGVDSYSHYWSSTEAGVFSRDLYICNNLAAMVPNYRAHGFSVRCIKD